MTQLFPRSSNTILRVFIVGVALFLGTGLCVMFVLARSPNMTDQNLTYQQPIAFSHQHHSGDIGIDCRYCHQTVENSSRAGVPSTQVCMNCHRNLWNQAPMLEPVRISYRDDIPIEWNRVHDLPDYVYFNHSIHIHKGIGCYSCHGEVAQMPLIRRNAPLTMQWCLECHKNPEQHVRPRELVFQPVSLQELSIKPQFTNSFHGQTIPQLQHELADQYELKSRMTCYTCHR